MKFLLFLLILLAMEPVVSGGDPEAPGGNVTMFISRHHTLRCMGNMGICRPSCRKSEQPYLYCFNYQSCCLQSYMKISISGKEVKNDWSQQNRWPKVP